MFKKVICSNILQFVLEIFPIWQMQTRVGTSRYLLNLISVNFEKNGFNPNI